MSIPIYASDTHDINFDKGNKGLLFERFFNEYDLNKNCEVSDNAKRKFLNEFKKLTLEANNTDLTQLALRQTDLATSLGGSVNIYKLNGHFVTGMGNEHPVENGFLWHYSYGVPYLSGAQVKGIVRSVVEQYYQNDDKKAVLLKWFGSEDKDPKKCTKDSQAGELIFFDALPYTMPSLSVDIMTPHMGEWYAKGTQIKDVNQDSNAVPADWHDPVPIPFLAVSNASFVFSIAKRPKSDINIEDVFNCLNMALEYVGAGAKTQTGYGVMVQSPNETRSLLDVIKKAQEEAEATQARNEAKANASPLMAELIDEIANHHWEENNDTVKTHFTNALKSDWLEKLEANPTEMDCINKVVEIATIHYKNQIKKPNKIKKPAQKEWILRLLNLKNKE